MKDQINFTGKITLEDNEAREMLSILDTRLTTLNDRTKLYTLNIKQLEGRIKQLENERKTTSNKKSN